MKHLFISDNDGALYDTRRANWASRPLRQDYKRHHTDISNTHQLRATLRAGQYAWPGGYPMYFIMDDSEPMCFDCARAEYRLISRSTARRYIDGWRVVACEANWEDSDLYCAHCNKPIESAYGSDES